MLRSPLIAILFITMVTTAIPCQLCPSITGSYAQPHSSANSPMNSGHCSSMRVEDGKVLRSGTPGLLNIENVDSGRRIAPLSTAGITQPAQPCYHCSMHSDSGASTTLRESAVNHPSLSHVSSDSGFGVTAVRHSFPIFLNADDHGPPGSNNPRYILNGTFRI